jgi:hypothetical protein
MSMVVAGLVGGAASVVTGIIGMGDARSAQRAAAARAAAIQKQLDTLEQNRQAVINPYSGVKDLSTMAKDLSGMISNPYANLGVATQAAKFEAEQIDLSLANTLDTLRETGSSAGGATALAMAALKSKQGISASIEQQEAQNEKLRAQGEQQLQQLKMSEAQRLQGIQISEGQRMQEAGAAGKAFMFQTQEQRDIAKLNRLSSQLGGAQTQQMQAGADYTGALTGMVGGLTSMAGSFMNAWGNANRTSGTNQANEELLGGNNAGKGVNSLTASGLYYNEPLVPQSQLPGIYPQAPTGYVEPFENNNSFYPR